MKVFEKRPDVIHAVLWNIDLVPVCSPEGHVEQVTWRGEDKRVVVLRMGHRDRHVSAPKVQETMESN